MTLTRLFEDHWRILLAGIAFALYGMLLDMGTSVLCSNVVVGCVEQNPLVVDAAGHYLPLKYLFLNGIGLIAFEIPLAYLLQRGFKSWAFASLPFWYTGLVFANQGAINLITILG